MAGALLTIGFYAVCTVFLADVITRTSAYVRDTADGGRDVFPRTENSPFLFVSMLMEIALLRRLLKANPLLWVWEWLFHASFALIMIRHLRYFLDPVPDWVTALQPPGLIAGYILPFSLLAILFIKLFVEKGYVSSANFFLLVLLLAVGASGLAMTTVIKTDLVGIKHFAMGIVTFGPAAAPRSYTFFLHFILFLLFVLYLPSHILTAPLSIIEARRREEGLKLVLHEK